jgi:hypothetical protein
MMRHYLAWFRARTRAYTREKRKGVFGEKDEVNESTSFF